MHAGAPEATALIGNVIAPDRLRVLAFADDAAEMPNLTIELSRYPAPTNSGQRTRTHVLWPLSVENGLSVYAAGGTMVRHAGPVNREVSSINETE